MNAPGAQLEYKRQLLPTVRRVVVKIGSGVLSSPADLRRERIEALARDVQESVQQSREIIVVTSGAVASGQGRLQLASHPNSIRMKQAVAAVGQIDLMGVYERAFAIHGRHVAQILLTRDDFASRARYLNAEHTLATLL